MPDTLYDGDHATPFQHGRLVPWWSVETRSRLYRQVMRGSVWEHLALDSGGPDGGFLVDESQPRNVGIDVLEWDRTFADVPGSRLMPEPLAYAVQGIFSDGSLFEIPMATTAQVLYEYFHTADLNSIPVLRAFRLLKVGGTTLQIGAAPNPNGYVIAEDSRVTTWRGLIQQRATAFVYVPSVIPRVGG